MKKPNLPSVKIGTSKVEDKKKFDENYDRIFNKNKKKEKK